MRARGLGLTSRGRIGLGSCDTLDASLGGSHHMLMDALDASLLMSAADEKACKHVPTKNCLGCGGLGHIAVGRLWTLDGGVGNPSCLPRNGANKLLPLQAEAPPYTD